MEGGTGYIRKKILFVCDNLGGGGAERVMALLLEHLDREKFEPYLVLFQDWHDYDLPKDVPVICFQKKSRFEFPMLIWRLLRVYKELKPDTVLNRSGYEFLISKLAHKLSRTTIKILLIQHYLPSVLFSSIKNPSTLLLVKWMPRWAYRSADKIICISQRVAQDTRDYYGLPIEITKVIYNPVDINKISALAQEEVNHPWFTEKRGPIVISVGRLYYSKGYSYLLKAFAQLAVEISAYLVILGEGGDKHNIITLAEKLGIENRVAFLGFQNNPFKYMIRSDCFVLASLNEGLPMVILEAMT